MINRVLSLLRQVGVDGFVSLLLVAILVAWLVPSWGSGGGGFSLGDLADYGISLIFFFYGMKLGPSKFRAELGNTRLHLLIHIATFIVFPVLVLGAMQVFPTAGNWYLWLGIFFMAALPSTVSSSVVMVSIARGNVPGAIFNASISSLMGVFLTPLWMSIFINVDTGGYGLGEVLLKLTLQVLIPIAVGMMLNRRCGDWAARHGRGLKMLDQSIIILIVYTSFCQSFEGRMFDALSVADILLLMVGLGLFFFVIYGMILAVCRYLKFSREDTITALFCGSKKSLVHGTAMSKVIVADASLVGIILLPIMIYHIQQLLIVSVIAQRFQKSKIEN